jgi:hypothetical protein
MSIRHWRSQSCACAAAGSASASAGAQQQLGHPHVGKSLFPWSGVLRLTRFCGESIRGASPPTTCDNADYGLRRIRGY